MPGYEFVYGVENELKKLEQLPVKVEVSVVRGALRAAGKKVEQVIQPRIPRVTGELASTLRVSTRKRGRTITAAVKIGNRRKGVFYTHMVLGGTKPHLISVRGGGALAFGGMLTRRVLHPGARANDFMREADAIARDPAIQAAFKYADDRLRRLIAAQGNAP